MLSPRSLRDDPCNLKFFENLVLLCTKPQSAETHASPGVNQETVKFQDMVPGHISSEPGRYDDLRSEGMDSDLTLQQFFSRPVLIQEYEWVSSPALFESFNPWNDFFTNTRVINRLSNYKLLQAKLHVKVVLNGSPFNYGNAILSYIPFATYDNTTKDRAAVPVDVVAGSQRPHLFLDPCNNTGGTIECPFVHNQNALNIVIGDWLEMGEMRLRQIAPLKHALGKNQRVTISIFAWATDVRMSVPTQVNSFAISPQSDEYSRPAFSTHATALAAFAGKLVSAPFIGPYMRATQIASTAAASIASMFGYSKPVDLELTLMRQFTTGQLAITNGKDDSRKLTVDAKQELTIDPRAFGLSSIDELEVNYIASRDSWFYNFEWPEEQAPGTLLFNTVVDPFTIRNWPGTPSGTELHMTAVAFATLPFTYWRGSLIYRFEIICSKFHRGRLRIVYDPETTATNLPATFTADYNTAYNTIIDISETTDFEIKVGWGQETSYRRHFDPTTPDILICDTTAVAYDSSSNELGNGTLAVYIVNGLVSPDQTIDNDISVNVFIRAADDFEVAAPTAEYVNRLRFQPQSEELPIHNLPSDAPMSAPLIDSYAAGSDLVGAANLTHFGETVRSFRPLLKRYNIHEYSINRSNTDVPYASGSLFRMDRPSMPFDPGFTSFPGTVTQSGYAFAYMTMLKYISSAFVGWRGSIRWKIFAPGCCNNQSTPNIVSRYTGCAPLNQTNAYTGALREDDAGDFYDNTSGMSGILAEYATTNPVISFEVPYYSVYRFCPARLRTDFGETGGKDWMPCFKARFNFWSFGGGTARPPPLSTMCAAGEDFTVGFFVGAPVFFLETAIPP